MNDADRTLIVERLQQGCSPDAIHAELPDAAVSEIAAIAETEGLTQSHGTAGPSLVGESHSWTGAAKQRSPLVCQCPPVASTDQPWPGGTKGGGLDDPCV